MDDGVKQKKGPRTHPDGQVSASFLPITEHLLSLCTTNPLLTLDAFMQVTYSTVTWKRLLMYLLGERLIFNVP
jgi:hypothetical protein